MRILQFLAGVAIVIGALYWIGQSKSSLAGECVSRQEDRDWSFLTFYNRCSTAINVVFCDKMTVGEIGSLFGFDSGKWHCRQQYVAARQSFATIKWVNEHSSVASHLLSSSHYQVAACKAPYKPRFTRGTTYACEKT